MKILYNFLMALLDKKKIEVRKLQWQQSQLEGAINRAKIRKQKEGESV